MKRFFYFAFLFLVLNGIIFFSFSIYFLISNKITTVLSYGINSLTGDGSFITSYAKLNDSGILGEEYYFDPNYYPYYSILSDNNKKIYRQVYANALEYETTFVPIVDISIDDLMEVMECVLNDHPELFWLGNSFTYKYNKSGIVKQIAINFNGTQNDKEAFFTVVNSVIEAASKYSTNYEKEVFVHDRLMEIIDYDESVSNNQSSYSALVKGKSVCAGYARAFQYIMIELGIPTYYVTGIADGAEHAWNIVKLDDGYYNVDITWDDELHGTHTLFNKTDKEFEFSHKRSKLSNKIVKCNAVSYDFKNMSNTFEEEFIYYYGQ